MNQSAPANSAGRGRAAPILQGTRTAFGRFRTDGRGHDAAALTYYAVLGVVPAVVALIAAVGLFGRDPQTTNAVLEAIGRAGPSSATETFRGTVEDVIRNKRSAGTLVGVGVIGAVWAATAWLDAFFRVANGVHGVAEQRRFLRRKAIQVALTWGVGIGLAVLTTLTVVTGPIVRDAADAVGASDGVVRLWSIAKWPVAAALAVALLTVVYRVAPNIRGRAWRPTIIGAVVAVVLWAIVSVGFGLYVASFGSYNATYGALGAVIVFLVWLWITNAAVIVGAAVDAALAPPTGGETEHDVTADPRPDSH